MKLFAMLPFVATLILSAPAFAASEFVKIVGGDTVEEWRAIDVNNFRQTGPSTYLIWIKDYLNPNSQSLRKQWQDKMSEAARGAGMARLADLYYQQSYSIMLEEIDIDLARIRIIQYTAYDSNGVVLSDLGFSPNEVGYREPKWEFAIPGTVGDTLVDYTRTLVQNAPRKTKTY